jgi:hypothetical protein
MMTVRKALTYAALVGIGLSMGRCTAESSLSQKYHLVPKSSYCMQLDQPLNDYFRENITPGMSRDEIYTRLELIVKQCGK